MAEIPDSGAAPRSLVLECRCSKGKKCPRIDELPDGSFRLSDDEAGKTPYELDDQQAANLATFLFARLRARK